MVGVDVGGGVNLEAVVVLVCVLEETVHGVEHLVRQQEEPLAGNTAVVETLLATEDYVQPAAQLIGRKTHDLVVRVLEQRCARHRDFDVRRHCVALAQVPELAQLPPE